jgi:hypothetical protein
MQMFNENLINVRPVLSTMPPSTWLNGQPSLVTGHLMSFLLMFGPQEQYRFWMETPSALTVDGILRACAQNTQRAAPWEPQGTQGVPCTLSDAGAPPTHSPLPYIFSFAGSGTPSSLHLSPLHTLRDKHNAGVAFCTCMSRCRVFSPRHHDRRDTLSCVSFSTAPRTLSVEYSLFIPTLPTIVIAFSYEKQ